MVELVPFRDMSACLARVPGIISKFGRESTIVYPVSIRMRRLVASTQADRPHFGWVGKECYLRCKYCSKHAITIDIYMDWIITIGWDQHLTFRLPMIEDI